MLPAPLLKLGVEAAMIAHLAAHLVLHVLDRHVVHTEVLAPRHWSCVVSRELRLDLTALGHGLSGLRRCQSLLKDIVGLIISEVVGGGEVRLTLVDGVGRLLDGLRRVEDDRARVQTQVRISLHATLRPRSGLLITRPLVDFDHAGHEVRCVHLRL